MSVQCTNRVCFVFLLPLIINPERHTDTRKRSYAKTRIFIFSCLKNNDFTLYFHTKKRRRGNFYIPFCTQHIQHEIYVLYSHKYTAQSTLSSSYSLVTSEKPIFHSHTYIIFWEKKIPFLSSASTSFLLCWKKNYFSSFLYVVVLCCDVGRFMLLKIISYSTSQEHDKPSVTARGRGRHVNIGDFLSCLMKCA